MLYTSGTTERPNPGQLIEVRDDEGEVLAAGEIGRVYIGAPEEGHFVRDLPRYETGKIYRRLVRDRYWAGRDRSI